MRKPLFAALIGPMLVIAFGCAPRPTSFKPVGTVKQIMEGTIHPASEVIFKAVGTIVSKEGVQEIAPKNDEEWEAVGNSALTLAESGNLLLIGNRSRDGGDWVKMAQALIDAGTLAWKATESKNADALFQAGGEVYEACTQCHSRYAH